MFQLFLNPDVHVHKGREFLSYPHFVSELARNQLAEFEYIAWVKNVVSGIWLPWLLDEQVAQIIQVAKEGAIDNIPIHERSMLQKMGILYLRSPTLVARQLFSKLLLNASALMEQNDYCVIPNILIPTYHNTIDYYMRHPTVASKLVHDNQTSERVGLHNLALFATIHPQLTSLIQQVIHEPIKASYCYAVTYNKGATLPRHTDRPQCEWNASIVFSINSIRPWPIYLDVNGKEVKVEAQIGEIVVYRGTKIPHWREELQANYATVSFFHFVRQSFVGDLN